MGGGSCLLAVALVIGIITMCHTQPVFTPGPFPLITPTPCIDGNPGSFDFDTTNDFNIDYPNTLSQCTGFPQYVHSDGVGYPICGIFDDDRAAAQACWTAGVNLDAGRTIRVASCQAHQGPIVAGRNYQTLRTATEFDDKEKYECIDDCFHECYDTPYTTGLIQNDGTPFANDDCQAPTAGAPPNVGDRRVAAVVCFDRNECEEGALTACLTACDSSCMVKQACAANTECTNDKPGWTCDCLPGFQQGDDNQKYLDGAGCEDKDECANPLDNNCEASQTCQNTIGSYVCSCNAGILYDSAPEPDADDQCEDLECPALVIANADTTFQTTPVPQGSTQTVACQDGYVSSADPEEDSFELACRREEWCSCIEPKCIPKSCGLPPSDPNAYYNAVDGVQGDEIEYNCVPGYRYKDIANNYFLSYTRECDDGEWDDDEKHCEPINLCDDPGCSANAVCFPLPGAHICICIPGYEGNAYTTTDGCQKVECESPPLILNAVKEGNGRQYGDEVTYSCIKGYEVPKAIYGGDSTGIVHLFSRFKIYCSKWGKWEPHPIPHCQRINCGYPGTICNADMEGSHFDFEDTVVYTCKKGYRSIGKEGPRFFTAECRADRYWTDIYSCEDINECDTNNPCGDTKPGYNGNTCINTPGSYRCVCSYGYNLNSDGNTCTADHGYVGTGGHVGACDWYSSMDLCRYGTCVVDETNRPYCRCNTGYTGPYCDRKNENIFEIIAITALVFGVLAFLIALILIFCLCGFCGPQGGVVAQPEAHIAPVPRPFGWGAMQRLNWRHKPWF